MRIHLVRNSTSANFGKNPKIFTCEFIQLVRPITYNSLSGTNVAGIS